MMNKLSMTIESVMKDKYNQLFLLILVLGTILRYYGIFNAENTDEYNEVMEALRVASGSLNYERWMKKGYQNLLAVEYGVFFVVGYLANLFQNPMDFAEKIVQDMEPLFLIGRYTTATLGILSILLLYVIGSKLYGKRVGLIASLFLSVTSVHVWTSHLVNTDVPLTFFFLLTIYFIIRFHESGKISDYIIAAFIGAYTINIKLTGVGVGLIFIMAHIYRCIEQKREYKDYIFCKEIYYSSIAFLIGLFVTNPPLLLGFNKFITYNYEIYTNVHHKVPYAQGDTAYFTYLVLMYREFGLPLFTLLAAGVLYSIFKREKWDYIFILFLIGIYLVLGGTNFLVQNRYLMTLLPILYLLGSRLIDDVLDKYKYLIKFQNIVAVILCLMLVSYPARNTYSYVLSLTEDNTSKISKAWIESNIPSGSKILMDAGKTLITSGPRLNQSREKIKERIKILKNLKEGETFDSPMVKIVDSYSSIYFELLLKTTPRVMYDITSTVLGENVESPAFYKNNGFNYFIYNQELEFRYKDPLWRKMHPKSAKFYDAINSEFVLIKEFGPSRTRSGPIIKIYKIQ